MVTLEKKKETVAKLVEKFKRANGIYLVEFMGMKVSDSIRLRNSLRAQQLEMMVAKNTLISRAMSEAGDFNLPEEKLTGSTAVIFGYSDPVAPARVIRDHTEKVELPKLKAAILEGHFYDGSQLKSIAALPTKPELIANILGSIQAPISGIVGAINAVIRDVAYLVEEVAKKQAL